MSCFIMNEKKTGAIAEFIYKCYKGSLRGMHIATGEIYQEFFEKENEERQEKGEALVKEEFFYEKHIWKMLVNLNVDAVNGRYDDTHIKISNGDLDFYQSDFSVKLPVYNEYWRYDKEEFAKIYKTLQCYLYQISEGDIPKTKIYKLLLELESRIARFMIENTEEYKKTSWG